MKRALLLLVVAITVALAWPRPADVSLLVIGQPSTTGLFQATREAPFFNELRQRSGLPLQVTYMPLDASGLEDTHQLSALKDGTIDLVSLRFLQNSDIEPSLQGIDLVGINSDYKMTYQVIAAYSPTVDRYLQARFNSKLLGVWSFGPQEIFCRPPIRHLGDLRGLKVRVGNASLSPFIVELGGTPVVMSFDETHNALAIGLIDCAVSSAASANFAGWPEHASYYFPIAVHFGLNGYAISLKKWQALSPREQSVLQEVFDAYLAALWQYSQDIQQDASRCNVGDSCRYGKPYRMKLVQPSAHDVALLRSVTEKRLLEDWGKRCEAVHSGCFKDWREKVGSLGS